MTVTPLRERLSKPCVTGSLPGEASQSLLAHQQRVESNARTYPESLPLAIQRGEGSYVEDLDGNVLIDFLQCAGALPLGHCHPEVVEAITEQAARLMEGLDLPTEVKWLYTEYLLDTLPRPMRDRMKIQYCGPTGANAVDAAIKLCKTATRRSDVIAFTGAFHGSTHTALAVSGSVAQKTPIQNAMPGVHFLPYPNAGWSPCPGHELSMFKSMLTDPLSGVPLPACVIIEPVQGEAGVITAPEEFLREVRQLTGDLGIPLIVDEIQCGYGRTGSWWAFERSGIEPDVICASKGIGGGMPSSVILYQRDLDVWEKGAHTGTFRGNQLAFAAGVQTTTVIRREEVLSNVVARGIQAGVGLESLAEARRNMITEVRQAGLMLAVEFNDPGDAATIRDEAFQNGLLCDLGGRNDRVLRWMPPLNVTQETIDQALTIVSDCLDQAR